MQKLWVTHFVIVNFVVMQTCLFTATSAEQINPHPLEVAFQENLNQVDADPQEVPLISEIPFVGWCFQHPNQNLQVIFEAYPDLSCVPHHESSPSYLLQFEDSRVSGFLYIKWDQCAFSSTNTFKRHLKEMLVDITRLEPNEITADNYEYDFIQGYGILKGSPYGLISLSGDGFLYGFAVKAKSDHYDINDLIHRIKWSIEY